MAIDINVKVRAGFFYKWMSVKQMRKILAALEDDDLLVPNRVGNLTVLGGNHYIGYIDFNSEAYESIEQDVCNERS